MVFASLHPLFSKNLTTPLGQGIQGRGLHKLVGLSNSDEYHPIAGDAPMNRPNKLLGFALWATLLVPAMQPVREVQARTQLREAGPQVGPLPLLAAPPPMLVQAANTLEEADQLLELGLQQYREGQFQETIQSYERALEIYQTLDISADIYVATLRGEGDALNGLGLTYAALGQHQRAIRFYIQAINVAHELGSLSFRSEVLGNMGDSYYKLGQYSQAIDLYERSLAINRERGDRLEEGDSLLRLGNVYTAGGLYQQAIVLLNQSLSIFREVDNSTGEGMALGLIGQAYSGLGEYQQAIALSEQGLGILRETNNRHDQVSILINLGDIYLNLGQPALASNFYDQGLGFCRELIDAGCRGRILTRLGIVKLSIEQPEQAIPFLQEGLDVARQIGDTSEEVKALRALGIAYSDSQNYRQAAYLYAQAAGLLTQNHPSISGAISLLGDIGLFYKSQGFESVAVFVLQIGITASQEIGDRTNEARHFSLLGDILAQRGQPEIAIAFYKRSVNIRESIRDELVGLPRDLQLSYTDTVADSYRRLANLLLQADRVLEAQEILDLLKLQELDDYQLRNVRGTDKTKQGLDFWSAEEEILNQFTQTFVGLDVEDLGTFGLEVFIDRPEVVAQVAQLQRNARGQNLNPEQLAKLQDNLQQAGNAALLYPLILDDRLELVLVTTSGLVRRTVPLDRVELNRVIAAFRADLTDRYSDPRPNAQQLYDWLIAPLVADLEEAGAETILYAADGQLRYIPLAALHDGDQWLTDRFTINHITAASLTDFSQAEAAPLNILAGAFPAQDLVIEVAGEERWFSGLPFAQVEVENLQANLPGTQAFFSAGFNRQAIEPRLADHTVIHLATHGTFRSGHPNDSFILLGDGDRITLFDLDQWELPNAALVVLSACETAVSGPELGTGEEILGFGYQIQRTGARAAIASLWTVSDGGTQVLMDAFYLALQNGYPKAEALRRSQQALIANDLQVVGGEGTVRAGAPPTLRAGATIDPDLFPAYSHPYYWAPFILIGNGL